MFTRTNSGLSNLSRFHRVDCIVYVEGRGGDERYWSTIFRLFGPTDTKFKFSSSGDCNAVDSIAEKICTGAVLGSIAVLDADFKVLMGTSREHRSVLYSYGYSYENDMFSMDIAKTLLETLSAGMATADCVVEFEAMMGRGGRRLRRLVPIELMYFMNHLPLLFNRSKGNGGVAINTSASNPIGSESICALLTSARHSYADVKVRPTRACVRRIREGSPLRWVFGHLVRQYAYHLITATASSAKQKKVIVDSDTFESIAISLITSSPKLVGTSVAAHYRKFLRNATK
jgi:hypothetical protein